MLGPLLLFWLAVGGEPPPGQHAELLKEARESLDSGEYDRALALVRRGRSLFKDSRDSVWSWRFRQMEAQVLMKQDKRLWALSLLATPTPNENAYYAIEGERRRLLRSIFRGLGDRKRAAELLEEAHFFAEQSDDHGVRGQIEFVRGIFQANKEGEAILEKALRHARAEPDVMLQCLVSNRLGFFRLGQHRYDEAIRVLEPALDLPSNTDRYKGLVLTNLGLCYGRLGYYEKGLRMLKQAIEFHKKFDFPQGVQASLGETGNIYYFQNKIEQATRHYRQALELALKHDILADASKWAGNLASTSISRNRWQSAEDYNRLSLGLKRRSGQEATIPYLMLNSAAIASGRNQDREAESLFREVFSSPQATPSLRWEALAGLARLFARQGEWDKAENHFEAALGIIEQTTQLLGSEDELFYFARLITFYQDYVNALITQGKQDRALLVAERSRARILMERQGRAFEAKPMSLEELIAAAKKTDSVLASYWIAPKGSYLWVINGDGVFFQKLPPQSEIIRLVAAYSRVIQGSYDPLEIQSAPGRELYRTLVEPVQIRLGKKERVILVPDGPLHHLNFETLPVLEPTPHYWLQDAVVAIAPSLSLVARKSLDRRNPGLSLLAVGDPLPADPKYPVLDYASSEVRSIQKHFGVLSGATQKIYTQERATPDAYRLEDPGGFSLIHFAAHAQANPQSPLDSAVILSPDHEENFKLYARDILEIPLNANVVTISACSSAGAKTLAGEGLIGFAWAFLQAGAKNVVAGLWDVADQSTYLLMDRFYEALTSGVPPAEALRQAKLSLVRSDNNYRKPYYWGPFQIYIRTHETGTLSALEHSAGARP